MWTILIHFHDIKVSMACSICIEAFSITWTSTLNLDEWMVWIPLKRLIMWENKLITLCKRNLIAIGIHRQVTYVINIFSHVHHHPFQSPYLVTIARYVIKNTACVCASESFAVDDSVRIIWSCQFPATADIAMTRSALWCFFVMMFSTVEIILGTRAPNAVRAVTFKYGIPFINPH